MSNTRARASWLLASVALLAGCGSASSPSPSASIRSRSAAAISSFPVTVTAANGSVTVKARPSRIVSLSPTATEDLYAIGAGPQVVAVDADSDYPAGAPVTKLSGLNPNLEALAGYRPMLVVASQDSGGLVSGLRKLGVPVLIEPAAATLDDAYAQIEQIGIVTGHAASARATVASMRRQIAVDVTRAGSSHPSLTYYLELGAKPYYSVTSSTFLGQIIGMFGLKDVADAAGKNSGGGYPELSQEFILTAKPQIIFLTDNQATDGGQTPAVVAARPGWSQIPAVRNHHVIGLNDDVASRWGPRLPQLVTQIAEAVEKAAP